MGPDGDPRGWMLGYPISEAGKLLGDGEVVRIPAANSSSIASTEDFVYSFGGRFAVVVLDPGPRFYLDPCGSLSAVYCAHQRMVASTPNLIPYDERSRDRVELAQAIGIPYTNGMYPLGLTPRYGVERILPNHYLDLADWKTIRHWPTQPLEPTAPVEEAVTGIATLIKRNLGALISATPACLPLTAGWDSRMLLACAREWARLLECYTVEIGDEGAAIDCDAAARIARRFGLQHRILERADARGEDLEEWMFRISYSTGAFRGWQSVAMLKQLPAGRAVLEGNIGEVGRTYRWWVPAKDSSILTPERLLELCQCPLDEEPLARARAWFQSVPSSDPLQIQDLSYIEQRLGCWAGVFAYAECEPGFVVFPMCHRDIIEQMLRLPVDYRRAGQLPRDIIAREWPALLEWPINQAIGGTRLFFRLKKAMRKFGLA